MKYAIMIARIIPPRISPLPVVFPALTPTKNMIAPVRITMKDEAVAMNIRKPQISWKYPAISLAKSINGLNRNLLIMVNQRIISFNFIIQMVP